MTKLFFFEYNYFNFYYFNFRFNIFYCDNVNLVFLDTYNFNELIVAEIQIYAKIVHFLYMKIFYSCVYT